MIKQELIDRSPVRFFEKALNGGIKPGELGVLTSKKGLGKTSILVQIGLDMLLQERQVVHVSFNQHSNYIMTWYEDIFAEMAKKKNLDQVNAVKADLFRKRINLNFSQDSVTKQQIIKTLSALIESGIKIECLIIDGLDFSRIKSDGFAMMKEFAQKSGFTIWYTCNTEGTELKTVLDPAIEKSMDVVIHLESKPDCIQLNVLKVRNEKLVESNLKLDPKTLLMAEK